MDTQLQQFLSRLQTDVATHTGSLIPTPRKLDLESILSAATVLLAFWVASVVARSIAERFFRVRRIDEALAKFLLRVTKFTLLTLGGVTALGTLGVDVSAIVAGLGLTGLALGIALKDVVSNAVSGVMLLIFRPFRHHDSIRVADFEGCVVDIDLRYTHLLVDDKIIFVPNSLLFANAVTVTKTRPQAACPVSPQPAPRTTRHLLLSLADDEADTAAAA
jgi:small-conductance mechanosensitive channel